jgi:hypothetical protein
MNTKTKRLLLFTTIIGSLLLGSLQITGYEKHCYDLNWCPESADHCDGLVVDYTWCTIYCTKIDHSVKTVECERPEN